MVRALQSSLSGWQKCGELGGQIVCPLHECACAHQVIGGRDNAVVLEGEQFPITNTRGAVASEPGRTCAQLSRVQPSAEIGPGNPPGLRRADASSRTLSYDLPARRDLPQGHRALAVNRSDREPGGPDVEQRGHQGGGRGLAFAVEAEQGARRFPLRGDVVDSVEQTLDLVPVSRWSTTKVNS